MASKLQAFRDTNAPRSFEAEGPQAVRRDGCGIGASLSRTDGATIPPRHGGSRLWDDSGSDLDIRSTRFVLRPFETSDPSSNFIRFGVEKSHKDHDGFPFSEIASSSAMLMSPFSDPSDSKNLMYDGI